MPSRLPVKTKAGGPTSTGGTAGAAPSSSGNNPNIVTIDVGEDVGEVVSPSAVTTESSLQSFHFYHATNGTGQYLIPGGATAISLTMPQRGSVVALTFDASTDCSGTYTVHKNGTAMGSAITVSADSHAYQGWVEGTYPFVAGDLLDIRATSTSTSAVVDIGLYVMMDPTTIL